MFNEEKTKGDVHNEIENYSLEFIKSQVIYYKKHLFSGTHTDRNMIAGLLHKYEAELRRRERC